MITQITHSMLKYLIHPRDADSKDDDGRAPKRAKVDVSSDIRRDQEEFRIVAFNANSLLLRITNNSDELNSFIGSISPHLIGFGEVRVVSKPYQGDEGRRDPSRMDEKMGKGRIKDKDVMDSFLRAYKKYYSLADRRYAGTLVAIHRDGPQPKWVKYTFKDAEQASLSLLPSPSPSPSPAPAPGATITDSPYDEAFTIHGHYQDGRLIIMGFETFDFIHTYAPNNGHTAESFAKRAAWDRDMKLFLERAKARGRPVVWMGDLNVAHQPVDVTHPHFFAHQHTKNDPANRGQAGYTPAERKRFSEIIEAGGIVDVFRHLNPASEEQLADDSEQHSQEMRDGKHFTWRGTAGREIDTDGMYFDRGMRIDYAMVSRSLVEKEGFLLGVDINGQGKERNGFLGSDHCPIILRLKHQ